MSRRRPAPELSAASVAGADLSGESPQPVVRASRGRVPSEQPRRSLHHARDDQRDDHQQRRGPTLIAHAVARGLFPEGARRRIGRSNLIGSTPATAEWGTVPACAGRRSGVATATTSSASPSVRTDRGHGDGARVRVVIGGRGTSIGQRLKASTTGNASTRTGQHAAPERRRQLQSAPTGPPDQVTSSSGIVAIEPQRWGSRPVRRAPSGSRRTVSVRSGSGREVVTVPRRSPASGRTARRVQSEAESPQQARRRCRDRAPGCTQVLEIEKDAIGASRPHVGCRLVVGIGGGSEYQRLAEAAGEADVVDAVGRGTPVRTQSFFWVLAPPPDRDETRPRRGTGRLILR